MAYTYTEPVGGVFVDAISEVRYYLNDRTPAAPFSLSDAEITFELGQVSQNRLLAASNAASIMAVVYGSQATTNKSVGNLSIAKRYDGLRDMYDALSRRLRAQSSSGRVAGGIFTGTSTDPEFYVGQFDNTES